MFPTESWNLWVDLPYLGPRNKVCWLFQQAYQNNWLKADSFILQEGLKFPKNLYPIIELSRIYSYQECK